MAAKGIYLFITLFYIIIFNLKTSCFALEILLKADLTWKAPKTLYNKKIIFFCIEFCTKSALQRCKCYSTIQICLQFKSRQDPTEISRGVHISLSEGKFRWER